MKTVKVHKEYLQPMGVRHYVIVENTDYPGKISVYMLKGALMRVYSPGSEYWPATYKKYDYFDSGDKDGQLEPYLVDGEIKHQLGVYQPHLGISEVFVHGSAAGNIAMHGGHHADGDMGGMYNRMDSKFSGSSNPAAGFSRGNGAMFVDMA
jgi:hypothetical protein